MNGRTRQKGWFLTRWALIALLVVGVAPTGTAAPTRDSEHRRVIPPSAHPYGRSYSKWSAMWWQWALSEPTGTNPLLDPNGTHCAEGQSGKVWFLAGYGSGPITRRCDVPAGKALFFPVVNSAHFAFPDDPPEQRTEAFVRGEVSFVRKGATALRVTLDGVPIKRIKRRFYTESTVFKVVLPADNLFGLPEGFTLHPSVSAGYNVMLAPLRPGRHTLHIAGSLPESSVDVTYHLR